MKLKKPKVYSKYFDSFLDSRGFLSALDSEKLEKKFQIKFNYQLVSLSEKKYTFRGFHYQKMPKAQNKIVIVHSGKVLDFVVKVDSPSSSQVKSFELSAGDVIAIPQDYAHGFLSLTNKVIIQYLLDNKFSAKNYSGFNANSFIKKKFTGKKIIISSKDKSLKDKILIDD